MNKVLSWLPRSRSCLLVRGESMLHGIILPIVSIVVPLWGYLMLPYRILNILLVKPKKKSYNGDSR